ncbi:MAG: nitrogen fixation protein NifZ [Mycoplasmoidaceae bacterium]|nr:nitrogen fixation protein NifZ [Mycoplasmoidaceae bacterium]
MTNKFKLGDKVKTLVEKKEDGSICKKGTIGTVCDVSHEDCIMIEANDANGE